MSTENIFEMGETVRGYSEQEEVFDRYLLEKIIGRGGMGVVWKAFDNKLEEHVAIKFLPENVRSDQAAVRDLVRETKRSRELTHANIVRTHDLVQDDTASAIVMEYVEGETLLEGRFRRPDEIYTVEELLPVLEQVAEAMDYAHGQAKIVHRDLKPANIMVARGGVAKVTDFGVARSLTDTKSRMTMIGASAGTMAYMSPQQLMGDQPSASDDIYALGATMFELLTGRPPFHSGDITMQVIHKAPAKINEERDIIGLPAVPQVWEDVIAQCLSKKPEERPATCVEAFHLLSGKAKTATPSAVKSKKIAKPVAKKNTGENNNNRKLGLVFAIAFLILGAGWFLNNKYGWFPMSGAGAVASEKPWSEFVELANACEADGKWHEAMDWWKEAKSVGAGVAAVENIDRLSKLTVPISIDGSVKGANVYIDGKLVGKIPFKGNVGLGKHTIKVQKKGYKELVTEQSFEVKTNEKISFVKQWCERSRGSLDLDSNLSGVKYSVRMLNSDAGVSSEEIQYKDYKNLPSGEYEVTATYPGLNTTKSRIVVGNAPLSKRVDIQYGGFKVDTKTVKARIYLDGDYVGRAPYKQTEMKPGIRKLELRYDDYKTLRGDIVIPQDGTYKDLGVLDMELRDPIVFKVPSAKYKTIKSAVDTALDGDTIEIAAGVYNEPLIINKRKRLSIVGAGSDRTVIKYKAYSDAGTYNVLRVVESQNITIKGIKFEHASAKNNADRQPYLAFVSESRGVTFTKVAILNSVGFGLALSASEVSLNEVSVKYNSWDGLLIMGKNVDIDVRNSVISSNKGEGISSHHDTDTSGSVVIRDTTVSYNSGYGVMRHPLRYSLIVTRCKIYNNTSTGIFIEGGEAATVSFNQIYSNKKWGGFFSNGFKGVVNGNTSYSNGTSSKGYGGLGFRSASSRPRVTNNKSYKNNGPGIYVEKQTNCAEFSGNSAWGARNGYSDIERTGSFK